MQWVLFVMGLLIILFVCLILPRGIASRVVMPQRLDLAAIEDLNGFGAESNDSNAEDAAFAAMRNEWREEWNAILHHLANENIKFVITDGNLICSLRFGALWHRSPEFGKLVGDCDMDIVFICASPSEWEEAVDKVYPHLAARGYNQNRHAEGFQGYKKYKSESAWSPYFPQPTARGKNNASFCSREGSVCTLLFDIVPSFSSVVPSDLQTRGIASCYLEGWSVPCPADPIAWLTDTNYDITRDVYDPSISKYDSATLKYPDRRVWISSGADDAAPVIEATQKNILRKAGLLLETHGFAHFP